MKRLKQAFEQADDSLLSIYFTAGYPALGSTMPVLRALDAAGVDMVEIGMPYSDPLADGLTIQKSSMEALANGMSIEVLFKQLKNMRKEVQMPVILMGYLNPIMQFGIEAFGKRCVDVGIDGLIIPDLPLELAHSEFFNLTRKRDLDFISLITPETEEKRIREIDNKSGGFIYMVSSSSTTGSTRELSEEQINYFKRIEQMKLSTKRLIGFGISDSHTFWQAARHADGAIVGSAFIKQLARDSTKEGINHFIEKIRPRT